jgi:glycosyltransferase involved in cell wall biosynthesis
MKSHSSRRSKGVLLIVADGQLGGGTTMVHSIAKELVTAGWRVHVATDSAGPSQDQLRRIGATVHSVAFFDKKRLITNLFRLRCIYRKAAPTLIHSHGSRALWTSLAIGRKQKTLHTVHGYHFLHRGRYERLIGGFLERFANYRVTTTVFVSKQDQQLAKKYRLTSNRMQTKVILNGVDVETLCSCTDSNVKSDTTQRSKVVFVGRLEFQKDPLLAIKVLRWLPSDMDLTIVGDGALFGAVADAVVNEELTARVQLVGALTREETLARVAECDVLLLTSRWEGLPLTPMEAMHLGVPVVAPRMAAMEVLTGCWLMVGIRRTLPRQY